MLETKLATLQNLVTTSMEESDKGTMRIFMFRSVVARGTFLMQVYAIALQVGKP